MELNSQELGKINKILDRSPIKMNSNDDLVVPEVHKTPHRSTSNRYNIEIDFNWQTCPF